MAKQVNVIATKNNAIKVSFNAQVRIDTPKEQAYFMNGGILQYVLRELVESDEAS